MRSEIPKVCHKVLGKEMIAYPVSLCRSLNIDPVIVVVPGRDSRRMAIQDALADDQNQTNRLLFATQKEQRGTGDAVRSASRSLNGFDGTILILYGDVPLVDEYTIRTFLKKHHQEKALVSFISMQVENPKGYGRVIRSPSAQF